MAELPAILMKWEYKIETAGEKWEYTGDPKSNEKFLLRKAGEEGWELVSIYDGCFYFKRPVLEAYRTEDNG